MSPSIEVQDVSEVQPAHFPDISDWYTPDRVAVEEAVWSEGKYYLQNARRIEAICRRFHLHYIVEAGCGTGWIPFALDPLLHYAAGIDKNPHMLARAIEKNPGALFLQMDLRDLTSLQLPCDLVCSFAILKHFSLTEWPTILRSILSIAKYSLFTQHALPDSRAPQDSGTEWHSCWPTRAGILSAVASAGHEIIDWDDSHWDAGMNAPEAYITTRRRS